ncbi:MAG: reverse transcriptase domain-containing protein, partial [Cyanobacteria bacterium J06649_11]
SVLGPLSFIIYINDLGLGLISKISKFADDTKLGRSGDNEGAVKELQKDLEKIGDWSEKWQMPFNLGKCKVMHSRAQKSKL